MFLKTADMGTLAVSRPIQSWYNWATANAYLKFGVGDGKMDKQARMPQGHKILKKGSYE